MTEAASLELTPEESFLLLTSLPILDAGQDERLGAIVRQPFVWEEVLWRAETVRTVPLAWYHLTRLGLRAEIPDHVAAYFEAWDTVSRVRSRLMFEELLALTAALDAAGIDYFVFKGSALASTVYPDPLVRSMLDLDVMVHPRDLRRVRALMLELGHLHAFWDPDTNALVPLGPRQLADYDGQGQHYELPIFLRLARAQLGVPTELIPRSWSRKHLKFAILGEDVGSFPLFVDVHLNLSVDFDLSDVWGGVRRAQTLGNSIAIQSTTGMVWFLAARFYHEAFQLNTCKLTMFGDLQAILCRWGEHVEWDEVVRIAEKYGMQPAIFYVLAQVRNLGDAPVPDEVLDRLRPDRLAVPSSHDWGDVMPKLLSRCVVYDLELSSADSVRTPVELRSLHAG